jgi:YfiH family protein
MLNIPTPLALPFAFPGLPCVGCLFGTRVGGVSHGQFHKGNMSFDVGDNPANVRSNRKSILRSIGIHDWVELKQVHGVDIIFDPPCPDDPDQPVGEGDGLATTQSEAALVIKTADCQPIMLAHKDGRHIAALHSGWRGNVQDFPGMGVRAFCEHYSLDPSDVYAVRGPSLGPGASRFENYASEFGDDFAPYYDAAKQTVNLWQLTRDQLRNAGLPSANIFGLDMCTMSLADMFFSYRRTRDTGRQASLIWIKGC